MRIAIIGAGPGGLASLKTCLDDGHDCVVYEYMGYIGGTWNYTEDVTNSNSAVYQGLKTNIPKELMAFEDYPYKEPDNSYITSAEVLSYINKYADEFNLKKYVKFYRRVINVDLLPGDRWNIKTKNIQNNVTEEETFDAVMICIGNYATPKIPKIDGLETFTGTAIHSFVFRKPDQYTNRRVLVIGNGPSGTDISRIISTVSDKVFITRHEKPLFKVSEKVKEVPLVKKINKNRVQFIDDSEMEIDDIVLCIGYLYSYPFLSASCEIEVENQWIKYLYKHIVNVAHPTMAFIGIPDHVAVFIMFGVQVRFFLAILNGQLKVTKKQMLREVLEDVAKTNAQDNPPHHPHMIGLKQGAYIEDLAKTADIDSKTPPVMQKLYEVLLMNGEINYSATYRLISDEDYKRIS